MCRQRIDTHRCHRGGQNGSDQNIGGGRGQTHPHDKAHAPDDHRNQHNGISGHADDQRRQCNADAGQVDHRHQNLRARQQHPDNNQALARVFQSVEQLVRHLAKAQPPGLGHEKGNQQPDDAVKGRGRDRASHPDPDAKPAQRT